MARSFSPAAIKRLVALMGSDDERIALLASQAILDRAYGKPSGQAASVPEVATPVNSDARERVFAQLVRSLELKVYQGRQADTRSSGASGRLIRDK